MPAKGILAGGIVLIEIPMTLESEDPKTVPIGALDVAGAVEIEVDFRPARLVVRGAPAIKALSK